MGNEWRIIQRRGQLTANRYTKNPSNSPLPTPYIPDEQYIGATTTPAPEITGTGAAAKPAPLPSMIFVFMALLMAWGFRRGTGAGLRLYPFRKSLFLK